MITKEIKQKIVEAMQQRRLNFEGSDSKFAVTLGISVSQYNRVKNGEIERVISDGHWINIARRLDVQLSQQKAWKTAKTPVYEFVFSQLLYCQAHTASRLLCDIAGIGKTYTAKNYVKVNKNAIYVDCSQVKTKQKLVRYIAKEFGVSYVGKYADVYEDLVFYLRSLSASPLVILDKAGDLSYEAFLETKALWNATEGCCAWYMMGADGLKAKISRCIDCKTVGYTEIFDRFGKRYQKPSPSGGKDLQEFINLHAALIIKANAPEANIQKILLSTEGSLRRIYDLLNK